MFNIGMPEKKNKNRDVEKESKKEMDELLEKFAERNKLSQEKLQDVSDSNFWTCIVFQSRAQAEDFHKKLGLDTQDVYIDGVEFAKKIGIDIIKVKCTPNNKKKSTFWDDCGVIKF